MSKLTGYSIASAPNPRMMRTRSSDSFVWSVTLNAYTTHLDINVANYGIVATEPFAGKYEIDDPSPGIAGEFLLFLCATSNLAVGDLTSPVWQGNVNTEAINQNFLGTGFSSNLLNSYITVQGANEYFDTKYNAAVWDSVTNIDKQKALIEATRIIDTLNYKYDKTDPDQLLEFPRNSKTEIPTAIKIATCEIALEILDGYDTNLETNNLQVLSHGYSSAKTQYTRDFVLEHLGNGVPSSTAWRYLRPYLRDPNNLLVSNA